MPKTTRRSEFLMVGFQCSVEDYRRITEAAENDQRAVSEWIRVTLMDAVRKAG